MEMRSKTLTKKILIIILLIAIIFGGINLFCYGFKYLPYKKLADKMQADSESAAPRYVCENNGYTFRVKVPGYLAFQSGYIYLVDTKHMDSAGLIADDDGELSEMNIPHVDLFVWPQMFGEAKYGTTIYEDTYSVWAGTNRNEEFMPDETLTDEENAEALELFEKHKSEIHDVMQAAVDFCGDVIKM